MAPVALLAHYLPESAIYFQYRSALTSGSYWLCAFDTRFRRLYAHGFTTSRASPASSKPLFGWVAVSPKCHDALLLIILSADILYIRASLTGMMPISPSAANCHATFITPICLTMRHAHALAISAYRLPAMIYAALRLWFSANVAFQKAFAA